MAATPTAFFKDRFLVIRAGTFKTSWESVQALTGLTHDQLELIVNNQKSTNLGHKQCRIENKATKAKRDYPCQQVIITRFSV
jgi:hypothetical protein